MVHDFGPIPLEEAEEFIQAISTEAGRPPPEILYLMNRGRDGLSLSFDAEWYPFIGMTAGYNALQQRRYIRDGIVLIERMKRHLAQRTCNPSGENGGRFFLCSEGVIRITPSCERVPVIKWQWPY